LFSRNSDDRNLQKPKSDGSGVGFSWDFHGIFIDFQPILAIHNRSTTVEAWAAPLRCYSLDLDAVTPNGLGRAKAMRYLENKNESTDTTKAYMAYNKRVQSIYLSIYLYIYVYMYICICNMYIYIYMYMYMYMYMYIFYADICNHISNWGIPVCIFHVRLAGVSAEQRSLLAPAGSSRPGNA